MKNWIWLCVFLYCGAAFSAPEERLLECKGDSGVGEGITLLSEGVFFTIKRPARDCGSDYVYKKLPNKAKDLLVISLPGSEDLGLDAKNIIYLVASGSNEAKYIGNIPSSANELDDGRYRDIIQFGGSIYENVYIIENGRISIMSPSRELMFSGTHCVYPKENSNDCESMSGSFKKSLCLKNHGERKVVATAEECSGLAID